MGVSPVAALETGWGLGRWALGHEETRRWAAHMWPHRRGPRAFAEHAG